MTAAPGEQTFLHITNQMEFEQGQGSFPARPDADVSTVDFDLYEQFLVLLVTAGLSFPVFPVVAVNMADGTVPYSIVL